MPINRVMNHKVLGWAQIYEIRTVRGCERQIMWTVGQSELLEDVNCQKRTVRGCDL